MPSVERTIWNKFHVHRGDNVPYIGWKASRALFGELFAELGYTKGAEIGVCRGVFSEMLCKANPNLHLYCIDPWTPYRQRRAAEQERNFAEATQRLAPYNTTIIKQRSLDAVQAWCDKPGQLDFVYIDGLHDFENVMLDIIHWARVVRPGGIVSGHDYAWGYNAGVVPAVDAYTRGSGILNWYVTRDREPSWLWVQR